MRLYAGPQSRNSLETAPTTISLRSSGQRSAATSGTNRRPLNSDHGANRSAHCRRCSPKQASTITASSWSTSSPLTSKRLDCLITGNDNSGSNSAVIVELKRWDASELTDGDDLVRTFVGGGNRDVLHPCAQANQYRRYLADGHEAFHGADAVGLSACAYLSQLSPGREQPHPRPPLRPPPRSRTALHGADAVPALVSFLGQALARGEGLPVMDRIERSRFRPSKRLLDHVAGVIKNEPTVRGYWTSRRSSSARVPRPKCAKRSLITPARHVS